MAETRTSMRRALTLPPDGSYLLLGPYQKDVDRALADFPRGTTCWYVILRWRGMELFIARPTEREALVGTAEKILQLHGLGQP